MKARIVLLGAVCFCAWATSGYTHWAEGESFKMHYPQLPDPMGWDVDVCNYTLADDWMCTFAGPVRQVHFWISWTNDVVGVITNVHLSIHNNFPGPPSQPMHLLWQDDFASDAFTVQPYLAGMQGWYDPLSNWWRRPDHIGIFQVNVALKLTNLFEQLPGMIYWLDVRLDVVGGLAGWKTSVTNFMDDATVWDGATGVGNWKELRDPLEPLRSLDLAFVIDPVPEPVVGLSLLAAMWGGYRRLAR